MNNRKRNSVIDLYSQSTVFIRSAVYSYSLEILEWHPIQRLLDEREEGNVFFVSWMARVYGRCFTKRKSVHASHHGEKRSSGGYHLKERDDRKMREGREKVWEGEGKKVTEANVSSDSSMNFPAVKRTGFWPLTISMFTGFCKLRGYRYQGIEYPAWPIASLWKREREIEGDWGTAEEIDTQALSRIFYKSQTLAENQRQRNTKHARLYRIQCGKSER